MGIGFFRLVAGLAGLFAGLFGWANKKPVIARRPDQPSILPNNPPKRSKDTRPHDLYRREVNRRHWHNKEVRTQKRKARRYGW